MINPITYVIIGSIMMMLWFYMWKNAEKVTKVIPWPLAWFSHILLGANGAGMLMIGFGFIQQ